MPKLLVTFEVFRPIGRNIYEKVKGRQVLGDGIQNYVFADSARPMFYG